MLNFVCALNKKIKANSGALRAAAVVLAAMMLAAAALLSSCAAKDDGVGYTIITPIVDPGARLRGSDFLLMSAFTEKTYTASVEGDPDTSEPGIFDAVVTVTDGKGYEATHNCRYTVRSYLRDSVRIEAGEPITIDKFINKDVSSYKNYTFRFEDEEAVTAGYALGTRQIGIYANDTLMHSTLIIEDTTPPQASPVTVHITSAANRPKPSDFVADVKDATSVAYAFKEDYDFNTEDDIAVVIILTDEGGNVTEIQSRATCEVDTTPPVISGVHDITVVVGGTVSYREGITVTDDSGETPTLMIDNSLVNLSVVGTYEVTYSAKDSSQNETIVRATVIVTEKPKVAEEDMLELAQKIYEDEICTSDNMTGWDVAYAIYNWTHNNIKYVNEKVDKNDPVGAAYDGFKNRKGDCFTYMATSRVLLNLAGIDNLQIERLKYDNEASHYWLLVDLGDGWYHFDSCLHFTGMAWESFMRTDAELDEYCRQHDIEYYYRFDKSKYPARETDSYYD